MPNENYTSCWTCRYLILDIEQGYICRLKGEKIADRANRYEINKPTDCREWERD